ncbi:hypothetical protein DFJ74DRAFT_11252 [Hyaloraphidium curvatum]|nr:hypothetical protein DFJ74DRAFT_11252 [Hyaloraphidium curvatum]
MYEGKEKDSKMADAGNSANRAAVAGDERDLPSKLVKFCQQSLELETISLEVKTPNVIVAFAREDLVSSKLRSLTIHLDLLDRRVRYPDIVETINAFTNLETLAYPIRNYLELGLPLADGENLFPPTLTLLKILPWGDEKPVPSPFLHEQIRDRLAGIETVEVCLVVRGSLPPYEIEFWESLENGVMIEELSDGFPDPSWNL